MKHLRIVILSGICILMFSTLKGQVKIGDNELNIGAERLLEIERANELLIVTDSLELGLTTNATANSTSDAIMMKLFGYGLSNAFTPATLGQDHVYFLGSSANSEVMEIDLSVGWETLNDTTVIMGLSNGNSFFSTLDLAALDSVFVTDSEFSDTLTEIRTLINVATNNNIYSSDGILEENRRLSGAGIRSLLFDSLTSFTVASQTIDSIAYFDSDGTVKLEDYGAGNNLGTETYLVGVESDGTLVDVDITTIGGSATLSDSVDLDENGIWEQTVDEAIQAAHVEIDSTIYNYDGTLTGNRALDGAGLDLSFNNIARATIASSDAVITGSDSVDINAGDLDIDASSAITIDALGAMSTTVGGNSTTTVTGTTVVTSAGTTIGSTTVDSTIHADSDGTVVMEDYGAGDNVTGNETYLVGVESDGTLVDVDVTTIGTNATLSDSVDLDENGVWEQTVDEAIQAAHVEIDSTIYNYNGTLTAERTMSMNSNKLFFVGTDTVTITEDGKMAIGRGSVNSQVELHVDGDILAIQVHSSSDKRFKKNITPVESALQKVMKINGVNYDFRTEEFASRNFPDSKQLGFIAQNVESVVPEVVMTEVDGYKAIDYAKLTALLNEAIKEQQNQIQSLQAQLAEANATNQNLAQDIAEIKAMISGLSNEKVADE